MAILLNAQRQFDQYAFQNSLPIPKIINGTNGGSITLGVWQTSQFLGLYDVHGNPLYTTVWGYGTSAEDTSYPGPTILTIEGTPITVRTTSPSRDIFCRSIPRSTSPSRSATR